MQVFFGITPLSSFDHGIITAEDLGLTTQVLSPKKFRNKRKKEIKKGM